VLADLVQSAPATHSGEKKPMLHLYESILDEMRNSLGKIGRDAFNEAVTEIAQAKRVAVYGVGREGLQIKGFAMRLFHLGLKSAVVGEMTTPAIEEGDLLIVSAGPGDFSTVSALIGVAKGSGARVLVLTANAEGAAALRADTVLFIPAQTMADDEGEKRSVLPMGSLYEAGLFVVSELLILSLSERLSVAASTMRSNHTNLE
jgi:6-phospho-3-hexuloisomerase